MEMIIGIGELLWDRLPSGDELGGAPANFALHARALGATSHVISRVGDDSLGHRAVKRLQSLDVGVDGIAIDLHRPTGTVDVLLDENGQPSYAIKESCAWDEISVTTSTLEMVAQADAICFGTLSQRSENSRKAIRELVAQANGDALRVLDVNLRQQYFTEDLLHTSLLSCNVIKLNDEELRKIAPMCGISGNSLEEQLAGMLKKFQLRLAACTRGVNGSLLYDGSEMNRHPGTQTNMRDSIGAGDSFTAAMTLGMLNKWSLSDISNTANAIAAYVCSCHGATPPLPAVLSDPFRVNRLSAMR